MRSKKLVIFGSHPQLENNFSWSEREGNAGIGYPITFSRAGTLFDSNRCTGEKMPSLRTARLLGVLLVSLSIFSLAAIHSTVPAHALSGPILSFNPASQPLASAGSTVTVNVNVTNISHDNP